MTCCGRAESRTRHALRRSRSQRRHKPRCSTKRSETHDARRATSLDAAPITSCFDAVHDAFRKTNNDAAPFVMRGDATHDAPTVSPTSRGRVRGDPRLPGSREIEESDNVRSTNTRSMDDSGLGPFRGPVHVGRAGPRRRSGTRRVA